MDNVKKMMSWKQLIQKECAKREITPPQGEWTKMFEEGLEPIEALDQALNLQKEIANNVFDPQKGVREQLEEALSEVKQRKDLETKLKEENN